MSENHIHELFPYLCVSSASAAIDFYVKVFGAREKFRLTEPTGKVGHAEVELGSYTIMLAEEYPELNFRSPLAMGGTPVAMHLHVDNADEMVARAVDAGAVIEQPVQDHFYGERSGVIRDPFGHRWNIGHHLENVTPEEMQRRYDEAMKTR